MAGNGNGALKFEILGPLRVERGGEAVPLAGKKSRVLLVRLLAAAGKTVTAEVLIEDLWDGRPPPSAQTTLQAHISRLRKLLGAERVVTEGGGYRLVAKDDEVDARCFEADVVAARAAAASGDYATVIDHLEKAEHRWRGDALIDAEGAAWAAGEVARLHELRLDALELLLEAKLAVGHHADVVAAAEAAVARYPLRERLWAHLITGMYRQGRQADALRAFQRLRHVLVEELGIEPGLELQELERAVLAQAATLEHAVPRAHPAPTGVVTFLFTDIEGSTALWERAPDAMRDALRQHNDIVRAAVAEHGGTVFATGGDGFAAAFQHASDAGAAALDAQSRLREEAWPDEARLRVRMGLHTGQALEQQGDYVGTAVNETARLMAAAHGGQVVCSASTAALIGDAATLKDLGRHRLRDLPRPMHAYQVGDGDFPRLRSLDTQPGNLPLQLTSFVGRERDVASVADAFERCRLVTLVGVGGMGKTRLALNVAEQIAPAFRDGAWFVELAAIADSDGVGQVVATTLGVSQRTGLSLVDSITDYLRTWQLLVVLDNCEHVLGAAADFTERVLRGCPGVKILATSREALGCTAEQLWPVGPLALPDGDDPKATSVELFVERARLVSPKFDPDALGLSAIANICRRVDGMPLAIELAASRVASMSPVEIAQLLDERFRLLTGGRRSAVERHQSLRAAVEWSYGLLSDRDRRVFVRLGVFAGSFDAASAVAVGAGDDFDEWEVREALASLVAKSLLGVVETSAASTRYQLAETLRAYARERLDATEAADEWRRRHALHFAAFAPQAAAGLQGPDEALWWDRLENELDNLRAAVTWALDNEPDTQLGVQIITDLALASATEPRLGIHGWAEQALFAADHAPPGRRAVLRAMAANHMHVTGQLAAVVRPLAEAALSEGVPPECPAPSVIALPLAVCEAWEGHPDACLEIVRKALRDIEERGYGVYHRYSASTLVVAFSSSRDDHERAVADAEATLSLARQTGCPTAIAHALSHVGWALAPIDPDAARQAITTAVSLAEAGARLAAKDFSLIVLARLHAERGDLVNATRSAHGAVVESLRQGDQQLSWGVLRALILIAARLGDLDLIATLVGATLRGARRLPSAPEFMVPGGEPALEEIAAVARVELGEETWMATERLGATMSIDQISHYALAALERRQREDAIAASS